MHLTLRSYFIIGTIAIIAVLDQWLTSSITPVWRLLATAGILAIIFERFDVTNTNWSIQRITPEQAPLGGRVHATWKINNSGTRPIQLLSRDVLPAALSGADRVIPWRVNGHQTQSQSFEFVPQALGEIAWPNIYIRKRGRFGLAWWSRPAHATNAASNITIVPDRFRETVNRRGIRYAGDRYSPTTGSGQELVTLRDYRPGDPVKSIDWKATARRQHAVVKEFSQSQHLEVVIVVDVGRSSSIKIGSLSRVGHFVNIAAKLAENAIKNQDRVGLVTFASDVVSAVPPLSGMAGLVKLRHTLAAVHPVAHESNPLAAVMRVRQLIKHRCLIVVMTNLDESESTGQIVRAVNMLTTRHMVLVACPRDQDLEALDTRIPEHWLDPCRSLAAGDLLHAEQSTVLRLQRQGCDVVRALPEQLDAAVLARYEKLRRRKRV